MEKTITQTAVDLAGWTKVVPPIVAAEKAKKAEPVKLQQHSRIRTQTKRANKLQLGL